MLLLSLHLNVPTFEGQPAVPARAEGAAVLLVLGDSAVALIADLPGGLGTEITINGETMGCFFETSAVIKAMLAPVAATATTTVTAVAAAT